MGFLSGLGRFIQGKPIFEVPAFPSESNISPTGTPPAANTGPKELPTVEVEEIEIHNSDLHTRITARITNRSHKRMELDKIRLLGGKRELDTWLNPGEEREFIIYEGNRPNHRNYDDAWLDYRDETGDYFQTYHTVEYEAVGSDGTYDVRRIRAAGPVKDI